ncbi:MAG: glycosyltransferase family 9 protein [Phycisphaerae bacterium]|nr:glycosyltransferase family 9 protein [Gemmatimonadaceae bacterium]
MSSLVIQTSFLGDMVLTTPLLERLATRGPVDVVATPANAALLANHPAVRDVILFDKRGEAKGWRGIKRIANQIRWRETERGREVRGTRVAYLAQGSVRSAWLAIMGGVPERIGFSTSAARLFYTRQVVYRRDLHHATRLWQLANTVPAEVPKESLQPTLFPNAEQVGDVDALLLANGMTRDESFVVLAPGSVWATKRWPSFDDLAAELVRHPALALHRIVVTGADGDRELAAAIAARVSEAGGPPVVDAAGKLSLLASAELISRAAAIVTNDSAPLHLASAMRTPTIALFGPTVPTLGFGPLAPKHVVIGVEHLLCRPCHAHGPQTCPLKHWKCMRELTPLDVAETLKKTIS